MLQLKEAVIRRQTREVEPSTNASIIL